MEDIPFTWIAVIILFAVFAGLLVRFMTTVPRYSEGFAGVIRGSGHPDSSRTLPEGSELLHLFAQAHTEADYKELELLLSKMGSLKKDLLSPSGIVDATRYQAFETAHDRIAVAELCGMCFSQTVPLRDLDITFTTWKDRGHELLRRLCTLANVSEETSVHSEKLFAVAYQDVYDIARSKCIKDPMLVPSKGDVGAYEPENLVNKRTYDYKYGGVSASGWNGAA